MTVVAVEHVPLLVDVAWVETGAMRAFGSEPTTVEATSSEVVADMISVLVADGI